MVIELAKDTDLDLKISQVIEMAWQFGRFCESDGISKIDEGGDSHIEFLRDKLEDAKDQLYALMFERMKA